jgi:hypothetical protein
MKSFSPSFILYPWLHFVLLIGIIILPSSHSVKVVSDSDSDNTTFAYRVTDVNDNILFQGGDVAFFVAGKWCVHKTSNDILADDDSYRILLPQARQAITGTDKTLGSYTGEEVHWWCSLDESGGNDDDDDAVNAEAGITIVTSFKNIDSGTAVVFHVAWPDGATNTSTTAVVGSYKSSLANYPSLRVSQDRIPNALSWEGSFTQSVRGFSEGTTGGPTVFFNADDDTTTDNGNGTAVLLETVIVGSPWNGNWKAFSAGSNQNWAGEANYWSPGTSGRIDVLPKGFQQSILLYERSDGHKGITATMSSWGHIMQKSRKPARGPFKLPDVTLEKIGYQTDNGAMYCFCSDENCSQTLLGVIEYLRNEGIPMGYLSFQGAGASSGRGKAAPWCIDTWGVDGGLGKQYPMDLKTFQVALGLPLQLYAPYFCPGSNYFDSAGHPSEWKSVVSDPTLPGCDNYSFENVEPSQSRAFYDWFLDKGVQNAGMVSFETDFMNQNHNCVPDFIQNATAAETWQQGMAGAARAKNVAVQWCYAEPTDILASLDMPAVTNFRVSFDFCYGGSYKIGESSLLVWAVGGAPSKDTLWSTDNNRTAIPGCPWTPDHEEPAAELHVVLALMSRGPVGISDAIANTNATLLKRIIRQDGTLLKPLRPITAIDSTFLDSGRSLFASPTASGKDEGGYVYGTAGIGPSWYFVSFLLPHAYTVKLQDFWPPVPKIAGQHNILAYRQFGGGLGCKNGADALSSGCVRLVELSSTHDSSMGVFDVPAAPASQSQYIPTITSVWQACPISRWILLGELDKYVPVSSERFQKIKCTDKAISITITGMAGEEVDITALRPSRSLGGGFHYTVVKRHVKISQAQKVTLSFSQPFEQEDEIMRKL